MSNFVPTTRLRLNLCPEGHNDRTNVQVLTASSRVIIVDYARNVLHVPTIPDSEWRLDHDAVVTGDVATPMIAVHCLLCHLWTIHFFNNRYKVWCTINPCKAHFKFELGYEFNENEVELTKPFSDLREIHFYYGFRGRKESGFCLPVLKDEISRALFNEYKANLVREMLNLLWDECSAKKAIRALLSQYARIHNIIDGSDAISRQDLKNRELQIAVETALVKLWSLKNSIKSKEIAAVRKTLSGAYRAAYLEAAIRLQETHNIPMLTHDEQQAMDDFV